MPTFATSPPRLSTIYLAILGAAAVVTLIASFYLGIYRHELHPDPTRGSIGLLLAALYGVSAFIIAGAVFMVLRWVLWPEGRSRHLAFQTIAFLVLVSCMAVFTLAPVLFAPFQPRDRWVEAAPTHISEGRLEPYFPRAFERLEQVDDRSQSARFVELAIEDSAIHRRKGFVGYAGDVSVRVFGSDRQAKAAMEELIQEATRDGYRPAATVQNAHP
jgi:predicted DNA-binding WGR domain protein